VSDPAETWVSCLTPPGQGALATLGLHGPGAWEMVRALFGPHTGSLPEAPAARTFRLGRLGEGAEGVADEAVLAVTSAGPPPTLELHCHGGREAVRFALDLFAARGARVVGWPDWLRRTTADPLRAAAAVALAEAATARTAAVLLDQHEGAFRRAVTAAVEALDRGDLAAAQEVVGELARRGPLGRHLVRPWRVALAGPPNVGKSSLLNALAGYRRSVVAATPGTTRDVVTVRLAVDGWPVELADTAGQRSSTDALEEAGVALARTAAASADLCLWLLDAAAPPVYPETQPPNLRLVVTKTDLPPAWDLSAAGDAPRVSAVTGAGVPELCAALASWLVPEAPPPGAAVPFTPVLADVVEEAQRLLATGRTAEARARLAAPG
jgi:tRNA modification GTPase